MALHMVLFLASVVGSVAGQVAGTKFKTKPTPVPILRFLDSKNTDGSYTYGFQSGDGTYKIETRQANGEVRGKYGYIDSNGQLREAVYGGSSEGGFEPRISGVVLPPPTLDLTEDGAVADIASNYVEKTDVRARSKFPHFIARNLQKEETINNVRIVNGRRAVLKKKLRHNPRLAQPDPRVTQDNTRLAQANPGLTQDYTRLAQASPVQFSRKINISPQVPNRQYLETNRLEQLRALETEKLAVLRLHQQRYGRYRVGDVALVGGSSPISHQQRYGRYRVEDVALMAGSSPIREQTRSQSAQAGILEHHPSISGVNYRDGSYTLSYK